MPLEGQEQLRYKSATAYAAERQVIEREINKLLDKRAEKMMSTETLEKRIIDARNEIIDSLQKEAALVRDLEHQTNLAIRGKNKEIRQTAKQQIAEDEAELAMLRTKQSISEGIIEDAKEELNARRESSFALTQYLGKFGQVFNTAKMHQAQIQKLKPNIKGGAVLWAAVLTLAQEIFEKFAEIDKAAADFRISMGMTRIESARVRDNALEITTALAGVGVTMKGALDATTALANEFGGTMKVSKDLVETTALLKAQLGVAEEASAGFMRNMAAISKTTAQSQRQMAFVAQRLASAAGVPLNMVMQDVAKMSGNALMMISRMPLQIVKTAVAARELGTTINRMAEGSRHILNFTESVQEEMTASVLVGKSINLQLARELAYRRDIEGSTREILRLAREVDFENLDVFQMEAFAAATGRSVDELFKMIQTQKQLQAARNLPGLKDEVATYDRLRAAREADLKDQALQTELTVKQMANQERLTALNQQWQQVLTEITATLFPIIDIVLKVAQVFLKLGPPIAFVWGTLAMIGKLIPLLKFVAPFTKAIPVIGWIIGALQLVASIVKHFTNPDISAWQAFKNVLYDVLLKPFVDVYNWIVKWFKGSSPSEIGWMIIKGLLGAQAKIFDAITSPFRKFFAWIVEKIPLIGGGLAKKIRGGATGALEDVGVLEKKAETPTVTPTPITAATPATAVPAAKVEATASPADKDQKEADTATLGNILKSLQELNSNLIAGKVAVYIDGQLLSATLARQTQLIGGYGTNRVSIT